MDLKALKALVFGTAIGFGQALAPRELRVPKIQRHQSGNKDRNSKPAKARPGASCTVSRHKRDPESPVLAAAIAKRARRAEKLNYNTICSAGSNKAHDRRRSLNPFYINREV